MNLQERKWYGWGLKNSPDLLKDKKDSFWNWLKDLCGFDSLPHTPPVQWQNINIPPPNLSEEALIELRKKIPSSKITTSEFERIIHARGKSYLDTLSLRSGKIDCFPDIVIYPTTKEDIIQLVRWCNLNRVAIIPFGGGTSVVGGVNPIKSHSHTAVISVDLRSLNKVLNIDKKSCVAKAESGIEGPALEKILHSEGYTLGHYPQSFEFSTLGGWVASRGAGHQSIKYGKAEHWFVSAEVVSPPGLWKTENFPASAGGPQIRDLLPGSEGAFGIMTEIEFKIHPLPQEKYYTAYILPSFETGINASRLLLQEDIPLAMIRLSDPHETFFFTAMQMGGGDPSSLPQFCLMLIGLEGSSTSVTAGKQILKTIIQSFQGIELGESIADHWLNQRFLLPYLRDEMLDYGIGVDTLETATRWNKLIELYEDLYKAIKEAIEEDDELKPAYPIVMAHLSHAYLDGASLYYTFVFPRSTQNPERQWWRIKNKACEVIQNHNATISHHHGVGTDHKKWIFSEKGTLPYQLLYQIKNQIDPFNIMNPGKLV